MKHILISIFAVGAFALSFTSSAKAQNFNAIVNQAEAAAIHCAQPYMMPHSFIEAQYTNIYSCVGPNGGAAYRFEVWVYYQCPPNIAEFCRPAPPVHVATVTTDCQGKIAEVICY